jgi:hypothetical protein
MSISGGGSRAERGLGAEATAGDLGAAAVGTPTEAKADVSVELSDEVCNIRVRDVVHSLRAVELRKTLATLMTAKW